MKPQGPRNPTAMPEPVPTSAGKVLRLAAMRSPPLPPLPFSAGLPKSKTNWLSFGRRAKRSAAVSARKSCCVRERVEVEVEVVDVAGGGAVPVLPATVAFFVPYGIDGAAREVEAKMAAAMRGVKSMLELEVDGVERLNVGKRTG